MKTQTQNMSKNTSFRPSQNADGISENHHSGINRLVKLSLVVEGKIIKFYKHFKLKQSAQRHHEFSLTLAHDALEDRQTHTLEEANKFLGKRLTAVIAYKDIENSPERNFVGIITKVGFSQEKMSLGNIVLSGYSPTILLDGAPHIQSFGGSQPVNMGIIAGEVIRQGIDNGRFDIRIDANDYSQIIYSSQYNETHYNYLARMAEAYGEQFYYDGEVLHFGKLPPQNKAIQLFYGSNANDINVELKAVHTKPEFYGYNSSRNEHLTSGSTPVNHVGDLAKTAYSHNDSIYKTPALQVAPIKASTHLDVENSQRSTSGSSAVNVFSVSGSTTVPFLHPGCVADIQMRKPDSSETSYFTRIMITEAEHEIDTIGHYTGSFEAIASDTGYLPKPDFTVPIAQPQLATVISNTDPDGQGRVQVRFDWQTNDTTHFIRMMSPDAGGTNQVTQNRGYVAIPEVGDQVMVNFVHSHPDRPFVMGGMFHGQTALGGGVNNHMRSIQTKSGIKVLMNDDEKSVTILDPSGNTYFMDGSGNIMVNAPNDITFTAGKNMNINVGENMNTTVGMNKSDSISMNHTESVGAMKNITIGANFMTNVVGSLMEFVKGNRESKAKEVKENSKRREIISQENNDIHSQKQFNNNSGENSKIH